MKESVVLFWFRRDLRLHDNAGLYAALSSGHPVVPVFIFDTDILAHLSPDDRRVGFIHATLQSLQKELLSHASTLDVRCGNPLQVFQKLLAHYNVNAIYANHDYEPYAAQRDAEIKSFLEAQGVVFHTTKDQVIFERREVVKPDGTPYSVFTPYAKRWRSVFSPACVVPFTSETLLENLHKQPPRDLPSLQQIGFRFDSSIFSLASIEESIISNYHQTRDTPSVHGTSRLGVHLRFGTISIRSLVARALQLNATFLSELIWREFFMQMLWHHPRLVTEACKREYDNIRWRNNEEEFERWCKGETGFPIVDAGMRELNATGFMHNRVRMIAASFLVKDLLIDWRWGEAYFAQHLMDYELASNNGNWQWVAGCGCDAAPYFRVFNPSTQAKRFDPNAAYIRQWVPEFDSLSYARPVVQHDKAKERCQKAYKAAVAKQTVAFS